MTGTSVAFGALLGLTWSASLRGYMAALAGFESRVDWVGTFPLILLPGTVVGAAYGWEWARRRTDARRARWWMVLLPLVFPVLALTPPGALTTFLTTGIGGGALAVAVAGILGGFAISGRGPLVARIVAGVMTAVGILAAAFAGLFIRPTLGLVEPRGAWLAILGSCLVVMLVLACSIPWRKPATPG